MPIQPIIPLYITVHLGAPNEDAQNVTVSFPDYIKNVASSEIFPTWPTSAVVANIRAQISFALNRVYTEYYRNRGYDFDITNSTAYDQSFVFGREIFENISKIVDEIFNSYIRRTGYIEPLFAAYCDGIEVTCDGLSQWGSVELAQDGYNAYEILKYYYGDDIEIVSDVPVGKVEESAPRVPLRLNSVGPDVQQVQVRLNRISRNFSAIPKIYPTDGIFDESTERAVRIFQSVFDLTSDGIVGPATWYKINYIYNGVKQLNSLNSEGLTLSEVSTQYPEVLRRGDSGFEVTIIQYYLSYLSEFIATIPKVAIDGSFGIATENAVKVFQQTYGLPADGIVGEVTWDKLYNVYLGIINTITIEYSEGVTIPYPGRILRIGFEGNDVRVLQEYLRYISNTYTEIPSVTVDGVFGFGTQAAVKAFQNLFKISGAAGVVNATTWNAIANVYDDLYVGNMASEGQYPGYPIS
ncbi:MAG: peptidoglycan-binding protein [Eubacteriales bacterium]|nr:peptidoglycan-binding protein [Eubacteriales bacterium]